MLGERSEDPNLMFPGSHFRQKLQRSNPSVVDGASAFEAQLQFKPITEAVQSSWELRTTALKMEAESSKRAWLPARADLVHVFST